MESFQVTIPFLKIINQLQRYIRGSHIATLHITNATIEFFNAQGDQIEVNFALDPAKGSSKESQMPLFYKDLQRIGYLAMELEKVETMYNWNAYAKHEMMDRFAANKFKSAWRITRQVFSLYQTHGIHNLLISYYLSANALLVMTKEGFTSLLEEVWRSHEKDVEFLITNN
ncbi:hypothetical protein F8M41_014799 [Gigaspora margarita]|uniref:Uncharacterized protein n=1 Tax=Gigaspora margarita TaxID=4874 RepID=A0A8H4ARH4_GIGMA|nr:hypothetical protein F8M41_014799 [Gigaspora margarita]